MEVRINNYPIDFELEEERTLSEVVNSIFTWTAERDLVFSRVIINDTPYQIGELPDIDLASITGINCIVQSRADLVLSTIDEGVRYCVRVVEYIDKIGSGADEGELAHVSGGLEWLAEALMMVVQLIGCDQAGIRHKDSNLDGHIKVLQKMKSSLAGAKDNADTAVILKEGKDIFTATMEFFRMLATCEEMKSLAVRSLDSPEILFAELAAMRGRLGDEISNVEAAAVAFQTGKDREGTDRLNQFIDFVYRYSRACFQVTPLFGVKLDSIQADGVTLEDKNGRIRDLLDQTTEIMENSDIISLSDTLEYEIKPELESLGGFMDLLMKEISG